MQDALMQQGMQSYFRGGFVVFLTAVKVVEAGGSQYKIQCFDCDAIHAALMDLAYRKHAKLQTKAVIHPGEK